MREPHPFYIVSRIGAEDGRLGEDQSDRWDHLRESFVEI